MEGKIHRVTYNIKNKALDLHLTNGEIKTVPMTKEEWYSLFDGDLKENLNKLLDE